MDSVLEAETMDSVNLAITTVLSGIISLFIEAKLAEKLFRMAPLSPWFIITSAILIAIIVFQIISALILLELTREFKNKLFITLSAILFGSYIVGYSYLLNLLFAEFL